jgi:hypothetical protein
VQKTTSDSVVPIFVASNSGGSDSGKIWQAAKIKKLKRNIKRRYDMIHSVYLAGSEKKRN